MFGLLFIKLNKFRSGISRDVLCKSVCQYFDYYFSLFVSGETVWCWRESGACWPVWVRGRDWRLPWGDSPPAVRHEANSQSGGRNGLGNISQGQEQKMEQEEWQHKLSYIQLRPRQGLLLLCQIQDCDIIISREKYVKKITIMKYPSLCILIGAVSRKLQYPLENYRQW